ncbi:MAG: hypothetical protein M0Z95_29295 [Actinomycetota bacterium]|jgi:hypothetical protein|nr:hypothetical protein [Actinomycetota bacterium]
MDIREGHIETENGPASVDCRPVWTPRAQRIGRWLPAVAALVAVAGVIGVTLWQLHLPLLLTDTTTTGGDTGAHYMMPAYFTSNLFPHLTGWNPGWYDGYPMYTFYFILPDVLVALASHVIAYNIAFKWATVMGSLLLPVTAWACGKLFRMPPPVPGVLAAATLPYLFDYTWTIYGGNLFSTLAGEYSFSLSLALAILFLGLFARGIRNGRGRVLAAVVLALCILAHIVPAAFALVGAGLLTLCEMLPDRFELYDDLRGPSIAWHGTGRQPEGDSSARARWQAFWWGSSTVVIGVLLSGWWLVPFGLRLPYTTSMNYTNITTYAAVLFPRADLWALVLAGVAMLVSLAMRSRFGLLIGALGGLSALGLIVDPQGSLYNVRLLPLWFIAVYLAAGWVFAVGVVFCARWMRRDRLTRWANTVRNGLGGPALRRPSPPRWPAGAVAGPILALLVVLVVVATPFVPALASELPRIGITPGADQVSVWADWNYTGYEGKADYPEYRAVVQLMAKVGREHGCGRAMWEYNSDLNRFGTPEALMLLPYWTGGCIDSMEGLLFESSATTPYHFLNQAELSVAPSEPMVGLPYGPLDIPLGVEHLQLLGVRYFMASSPQVQLAASEDPTLRFVASTGPWRTNFDGETLSTTWDVYEVRHSTLVTPLTRKPAVLTGVGPSQVSWLGTVGPQGEPIDGPSVAWYEDPARWAVPLVADGPASWPRVTRAGAGHPPSISVPATKVTDVRQTADSVSFHVGRIGTPVLVKVSYFPNWHVSGGNGPWRSTPNLMVVVPTSHRVELTYGTTPVNDLGDGCTAFGIFALVILGAVVPTLRRRRRRRSRPSTRRRRTSRPPSYRTALHP